MFGKRYVLLKKDGGLVPKAVHSPTGGPEGGSEPEPEPPVLVSSLGFDILYLNDLGQVI